MVRQHSTYIGQAPGWTEVEGINLYHSPLGFLGEEPQAPSHLTSQSCKIRILILQVSKGIQMLPAASASLDPHLPNCPVSPLTASPVFLFSEGWNHSSRGRGGGTDTPGTLGDGAQRKQTPLSHTVCSVPACKQRVSSVTLGSSNVSWGSPHQKCQDSLQGAHLWWTHRDTQGLHCLVCNCTIKEVEVGVFSVHTCPGGRGQEGGKNGQALSALSHSWKEEPSQFLLE